MKTIKKIINNLKKEQNQEFNLFDNKLNINYSIRFEFIDDFIYMTCNGSTLNGMFFKSLNELERYLKNTFINDKNYKLQK